MLAKQHLILLCHRQYLPFTHTHMHTHTHSYSYIHTHRGWKELLVNYKVKINQSHVRIRRRNSVCEILVSGHFLHASFSVLESNRSTIHCMAAAPSKRYFAIIISSSHPRVKQVLYCSAGALPEIKHFGASILKLGGKKVCIYVCIYISTIPIFFNLSKGRGGGADIWMRGAPQAPSWAGVCRYIGGLYL